MILSLRHANASSYSFLPIQCISIDNGKFSPAIRVWSAFIRFRAHFIAKLCWDGDSNLAPLRLDTGDSGLLAANQASACFICGNAQQSRVVRSVSTTKCRGCTIAVQQVGGNDADLPWRQARAVRAPAGLGVTRNPKTIKYFGIFSSFILILICQLHENFRPAK
ncbi:hypothetical protein [Parachitinimonas caeni]|uniref:Uncharacterized protein n=1 Tax=Parachitinimonas caeni TaxID=3031301 RepID=A0ABT7DWI8_9NEIS|nr:hypothetical protein [Parachitinimonas caeni]MDK2124349.1 hypothetical protein [Parachitinimonas caeni]